VISPREFEKTQNLFYRLRHAGFQILSELLLKFVTRHPDRWNSRLWFSSRSKLAARELLKTPRFPDENRSFSIRMNSRQAAIKLVLLSAGARSSWRVGQFGG